MNKIAARFTHKGVERSMLIAEEHKAEAEKLFKKMGIDDLFWFFEPIPPTEFDEQTVLLKGDVGFEITLDSVAEVVKQGKRLLLDTFGGDLWEGLKTYDWLKAQDTPPEIGILGTCFSAGTLVALGVPPENRWMSANSSYLVHNPWMFGDAGDDEYFLKLSEELKFDKIRAAKIYADETGRTVEEMLALMKEDRILDFDEAAAFGFVTNKGLFKFDNTEMKEVTEKIGALESKLDKFMKLFKKAPKALVIQDVNGVEIDFGDTIETSDQIAVGAAAEIDGAPAEGTFTLEDGTEYVFTEGALEAINEPAAEDEEAQALRDENEALKAENETLKAESSAAQAQLAEAKKQMEVIDKEVKALKKLASNETADPNLPPASEEPAPKKGFSYKSKK